MARGTERGVVPNEFVEDPGFLQVGPWSSRIWHFDMTYLKKHVFII